MLVCHILFIYFLLSNISSSVFWNRYKAHSAYLKRPSMLTECVSKKDPGSSMVDNMGEVTLARMFESLYILTSH